MLLFGYRILVISFTRYLILIDLLAFLSESKEKIVLDLIHQLPLITNIIFRFVQLHQQLFSQVYSTVDHRQDRISLRLPNLNHLLHHLHPNRVTYFAIFLFFFQQAGRFLFWMVRPMMEECESGLAQFF